MTTSCTPASAAERVTIRIEGPSADVISRALTRRLLDLRERENANITLKPLSGGFASDLDVTLIVAGINLLSSLIPLLIELLKPRVSIKVTTNGAEVTINHPS